MALTGIPLILLAATLTAAVLAATIVGWHRLGKLRLPARIAGVLLTEALLLLSVGLVANRHEQFYPSWEALLQTGTTAPTAYKAVPGHLDGWLKAQLAAQPQQPFTFAWKPAGWTGWHLAAAPAVLVPAGYELHPAWRYPVVLVLADPATAWTDAVLSSAAAAAGPAVVVLVRATPTASTGILTGDPPGRLGNDVRVTAHRWALVAAAGETRLGHLVVHDAPGRYPAFAALETARGRAADRATGTPVVLPAGIDTTIIRDPASTADPAAGLRAALIWAVRQTPPPLAPSAPNVRYVPIHHPPKGTRGTPTGRPTPVAAGTSSTPAAIAARPRGGSHVSGQPRP